MPFYLLSCSCNMQLSPVRTHTKQRTFQAVALPVSFVLLLVLFGTLYYISTPHFGIVHYRIDSGPLQEGRLPLFRSSEGEHLTVTTDIFLPPLASRAFVVRPDDCLDALVINGQPVADSSLPFCDYVHGRLLDLTSFLRLGKNTLQFTIRDHGGMGGLAVSPARLRPLPIILLIGFLLALMGYGALLARWFLRRQPALRPFAYLLLASSLLRIVYLLVTPYTVRGHDADGHLEYVRYVLAHWSFPDPHGGWEFYHPPLYYILGAAWLGIGRILGLAEYAEPFALQLLAFLLSIVILFLFLWIALLLFPIKKRRWPALLFFAICATLPSIVFLAARINNDALVFPLSLAVLCFLLRFWRNRRPWDWYGAALFLSLALLTKGTAFLLVFPLSLTMLLLPHTNLIRKFELWSAGIVCILLFSGWFYGPRFFREERTDAFLVGNIRNLNSALRTERSLRGILTMNPLQILRHPFNNPWSDEERRGFLWEYILRSAFFGEFGYPRFLRPLAIAILAFTLALVPTFLIGLFYDFRRHFLGTLPLWSSLVATLTGFVGMYLFSPYASLYDFRYGLLAAPTASFYVLSTLLLFPKILRVLGIVLLLLLIGANTAFLLSLAVFP